jgi:hypothetical protein
MDAERYKVDGPPNEGLSTTTTTTRKASMDTKG